MQRSVSKKHPKINQLHFGIPFHPPVTPSTCYHHITSPRGVGNSSTRKGPGRASEAEAKGTGGGDVAPPARKDVKVLRGWWTFKVVIPPQGQRWNRGRERKEEDYLLASIAVSADYDHKHCGGKIFTHWIVNEINFLREMRRVFTLQATTPSQFALFPLLPIPQHAWENGN